MLLTCALISELPSIISTMVHTGVDRMGGYRAGLISEAVDISVNES